MRKWVDAFNLTLKKLFEIFFSKQNCYWYKYTGILFSCEPIMMLILTEMKEINNIFVSRLLGPATAADVLQLTSGQANFSSQTRVVLANEDLRFISRQDDDLFDELFQVSFAFYVTPKAVLFKMVLFVYISILSVTFNY